MVKLGWSERLKKWRQGHDDTYARAIMEPPEQTTLLRAIPPTGLVLIMGEMRKGKSALAHDIAERLHKKSGRSAVLHLPKIPPDLHRKIQHLLPRWMKLVHTTAEWPKHSIVIYDEAAQGAHARRTQAADAIELDNLMSISGQRDQLIIFISHHSRKLDPNVLRGIGRLVWKSPSFAHWLFERDEISDFVLKAIDFFQTLTPKQALKTAFIMDLHQFKFQQFTNKLPSYWSDQLSKLFEDVRVVSTPKTKKGGKTE